MNELEKENAELKEKYLRSIAENDNLRKRFEKQINDAKKYGHSDFAKDVVEIVDTFRMALNHMSDQPDIYEVVLDDAQDSYLNTLNVMKKHGIEIIDPKLGDKFDPNIHESMAQVEHQTINSGHIAEVRRPGYRLHDRLIRPAMVDLAK